MKLKCENIGKLSSVEVEINTITLIAGLNNTGKSTIGKVLYSIFNSFYNFEEESKKTLKNFIRNQILEMSFPFLDVDDCVDQLYQLRFRQDANKISSIIKEYSEEKFFYRENSISENRILELLNLTDDEIHKQVLQSKFNSEFGSQIQNIFSDKKESSVSLIIKDSPIFISIMNDKIDKIENFQNIRTEVVYIDDPFILDNLVQKNRYIGYGRGHKAHLSRKLAVDYTQDSDMDAVIKKLITTNRLSNIYNKINAVCTGNIISETKAGCSFQYDSTKKILGIENLSTGLKTFAIIKALLLNGTLVHNGTIILDEPEIHLHPEWQKKLAEIIVLLQKEFGMHILLNSHSPYFINAIDVYAQKYKIRNTCKFYLAKNIEDSQDHFSELEDVSDNLEKINRLLFIPLQDLENERAEIEEE